MFEAAASPYLVPFDGTFSISKAPGAPSRGVPNEKQCKSKLEKLIEQLDDYQKLLYADDRRAVLLIFQAMDAAGKDSTIRAVTTGVNPAGCQVFSFKQPSRQDLDHDFLWRTTNCLPERGRIGIFNRSYYEEVLVVRVHNEYLQQQRLPEPYYNPQSFWQQRFESICDHEKHLARNGTVIVKFWLNVSKEEQRRRFLARIDVPHKNWKFSATDVRERLHWDAYMQAYEEALNATSHPWAPWYAVPADNKPYLHLTVAQIICQTFEKLGLEYPQLNTQQKAELRVMQTMLEDEGQGSERK